MYLYFRRKYLNIKNFFSYINIFTNICLNKYINEFIKIILNYFRKRKVLEMISLN